MPDVPTYFAQATFYEENKEETQESILAACQGSILNCLTNIKGVFRFFDDNEGLVRDHISQMDRLDRDLQTHKAALETARIWRTPHLKFKIRRLGKEIESMKSYKKMLVIKQMSVSDQVLEEVRPGLLRLVCGDDLDTLLETLYAASDVEVSFYGGSRLDESYPFVLAA